MNVLINYFGLIAENLDKTSEEIALETTNEKIDLRDFFETRYPVLKNISYKIAVNQEFNDHLELGTVVKEIALLPPFAGG